MQMEELFTNGRADWALQKPTNAQRKAPNPHVSWEINIKDFRQEWDGERGGGSLNQVFLQILIEDVRLLTK